MKGIVVELNKNKAVILTDYGQFEEIRNQCYDIGQTIIIKDKRKGLSKVAAGVSGLAAAFALCTAGAYAYCTPTDYVSLDVNPSVVYTVNRFERILDAEAANDDGSEILVELNLKNKSLEEGIKETLEQLLTDGYLGQDPDGGIVISTSNKRMDEAQRMASNLEQEIKTYLKKKEGFMPAVKAEAVKPEQVTEAKELGVSAGKLNLVKKLEASTSGAINREEWLSMSVKDINKAIKDNRKNSDKNHDTRNRNGSFNNEKISPPGDGAGERIKESKDEDKGGNGKKGERNDERSFLNEGDPGDESHKRQFPENKKKEDKIDHSGKDRTSGDSEAWEQNESKRSKENRNIHDNRDENSKENRGENSNENSSMHDNKNKSGNENSDDLDRQKNSGSGNNSRNNKSKDGENKN